MGQGGYITLLNNTAHDWVRTHEHSYQMNSWEFPEIIQAGKTVRIYVEWNEGIGKYPEDDAGEAIYGWCES